ncbi:hypothetical protein K4A83_10015 [Spirulina subsalsa FACHB-351]|uniref:EF-hand domain-containing protein n=1 Tax=Spirulina subsalsa FACHB-351 TaxID=234711 RepID=A0ABT3L6H9_9CYAN|nr:hypothetical protein [Spirulina subsalsa]MCW6036595.1 hypothetical protein [Spirulina subsalsa FACHB-351]
MTLFNTILGAINNPQAIASAAQLGSIASTVQQLSATTKTNPQALQGAIAIVGKYVRSSLQSECNSKGEGAAQAIVNQYSGTTANNQVVQLLLSQPQMQQLLQEVEQKTGLNGATVQALLPTLIPLILQFLQSGTSNENPQSSNPVLKDFLDSNGDGTVDLQDALQLAARYLR